jgi:hypothetical protein
MGDVWPREVRVWLTARQNLLARRMRYAANALFLLHLAPGTELAWDGV